MGGGTNRAEYNGHSPFASLDYESQVSNLESSVKKMTAMLQVQLEVLDKKIENGIGLVKRDLKKEIEERAVLIENELKELEGRTNSLGRSLGELKEMGLLSKEEFERFWNELKKSRNFDGSGNDVSLDEVRVLAKAIVEKEIERHAADGIGRPDYALASGGARIVGHSEPGFFGRPSSWLRVWGRNHIHQNAKKMLEPSFGEPGQCFALKGSTGFVDIKLRTAVFIEAITLEHVSESVSHDRSAAPKKGRVYGWIQSEVTGEINKAQSMVQQLLDFEYDLEKNNVQTFDIDPHTMIVVDTVRLEVTSNHGNSNQTCIYRLRVHGFEADPVNKVLALH
ncbi:SUN domain-containing protein 1-like [Dioscorea cayenensis subsp. rotundata]|uniref:SUN domain-containing protein 1-like n=1 Tax=Dioscorea cayennensis subsp. rotundata TaxID=55577 RepID=A0AB40CAE3_DIOCR|nr:SUN domain-containing protein 1-like [Dioscorea cayenensis subsp. rotundata]XP_039136859.1 SUN domain-containing protein 1-like [Dioscorea cayenensis subsp. rotundata]XP_039136860.1 SUN domain-containing protein 1-like [Dioscorea cayenensis subsp. rotundata]